MIYLCLMKLIWIKILQIQYILHYLSTLMSPHLLGVPLKLHRHLETLKK